MEELSHRGYGASDLAEEEECGHQEDKVELHKLYDRIGELKAARACLAQVIKP